MEDKGQMDEVIEQMKLMNVLLSKHDKREETKETREKNFNSKSFWGGIFIMVFLFLMNKVDFQQKVTEMSLLQQRNEYSLLRAKNTPPMDDQEIDGYISPRDVGGG